jgi:acyl-CoA thioester hydrolase
MNFSIDLRVYWEDTDAGGIVYYANYLKYFERARSDWLRSAGIVQSDVKEQGMGMFVVNEVQLKYHNPARLDDLLRVSAAVVQLRGASITMAQEAWRIHPKTGEKTQLLVIGQVSAAWVDPVQMKPARIPTSLREALLPSPNL